MMQEDFMIFYKIRKKIVDFYISCNVTIRNKYLFRYVSDISIIKIKSFNNYLKLSVNIMYMTQNRSIPHNNR